MFCNCWHICPPSFSVSTKSISHYWRICGWWSGRPGHHCSHCRHAACLEEETTSQTGSDQYVQYAWKKPHHTDVQIIYGFSNWYLWWLCDLHRLLIIKMKSLITNCSFSHNALDKIYQLFIIMSIHMCMNNFVL